MTLYETMFRRRSVRRYLPEPFSAAELDEVLAYVRAVEPLPGQQAEFRIIGPEEMGLNLAPHYLVASCEAADAAYANVGYVLEKLDLWLQSRGFGSLWFGMKLPREQRHDDAIVMAFGRTELPLRGGEADFSRLKLSDIASGDTPVLRAARLAPSAVNSQPWQLEQRDGAVVIRYKGRGLMKARLEKKLNKIDCGIVTRFAVTALEQQGRTLTAPELRSEGRDFVITVPFA